MKLHLLSDCCRKVKRARIRSTPVRVCAAYVNTTLARHVSATRRICVNMLFVHTMPHSVACRRARQEIPSRDTTTCACMRFCCSCAQCCMMFQLCAAKHSLTRQNRPCMHAIVSARHDIELRAHMCDFASSCLYSLEAQLALTLKAPLAMTTR